MKAQNRLALIMTFFAWLVSAVVVSSMYVYNRQQTREDMRQRLLEIAALGVQRLDGDLHATLVDPKQVDSEEYRIFQGWLQEIRNSSPDLAFVYTMRYDKKTNQMVFVVDAETNPQDASRLGDLYTEIDPALLEQLATLQVVAVDAQPLTARWGTLLSGYAPIRTSSGEVDAILGVDMSLERIQAYERRLLIFALIVLALVTPLIILIGRWMGQNVARPLVNITRRAENVANSAKTGRLDQLVALTQVGQVTTPAKKRPNPFTGSPLEFTLLDTAFTSMTEQMLNLVSSLEERVEERTHELNRRTNYLQDTAELTLGLSTELDTNQLAKQAVQQICQRFNLYYVGLFLLDEKGEWAILRAAANSPAAGNASQNLLERDLRLLVPAGMVGWSIANGRPRVAQAARQDEVRITDADLPGTLSEAALPLRGRHGVIGALNLHSDKLNAFDDAAITVLTIMADLLGITLENTRLLERTRSKLDTELVSTSKTGEGAWQQLTQVRRNLGYRYAKLADISGEIAPIQSPAIDTAFKQAMQGQPAVQASDGRLVLPIKVRQEVIGAISFKRPQLAQTAGDGQSPTPAPTWLEDEIEILKEMLDNVGQALEGARLYQETQRRAAREQITSEITASMRASLDLETVLQTAVREIGEKLLGELGAVIGSSADAGLQAPGNDLVVEVHLGEEA